VNSQALRAARRWPGPAARLTEEEVAQIRREAARRAGSQREIARLVGIHESTVSRIVTGKAWRTEAVK
jgi:DNA invertase Pin-like site-specific DNA recombinase